jgi:methylphosphotriester-DNA--protein-cysteine methyltransferase
MNNEPVAWMQIHYKDKMCVTKLSPVKTWEDDVPLYTHPVKELNEQFKKGFEAGKEEGWKAHKFHHPVKELTDEEIIEIAKDCGYANRYKFNIKFARAILRKAQER